MGHASARAARALTGAPGTATQLSAMVKVVLKPGQG